MAAASTSSASKELDDITECPICADVFNDPRTLPCVHTYCLRCIDGWCHGKPPGAQVNCPLCRKAFVIPVGGIQNLPKNFLMEKLKQIKLPLVAVDSQFHCDECDKSNSPSSLKQVAVMHCIDCGKKLCKRCDQLHQKSSVTRMHRREKLEMPEINKPCLCDKHKNKNLELYCEKCQVPLCAICYIDAHNSHKCTDIDMVAQDFRGMLINNTKLIGDLSAKWHKDLGLLKTARKDFVVCADSVEREICERAEFLNQIVEIQKQQNLSNLLEIRADRLRQVDCSIAKIDQQLMLMENLLVFTDEICSKGASGHIVTNAKSLQLRAETLMKSDFVSSELNQLGLAKVTFSPSDIINSQCPVNCFGEVCSKVTHSGWAIADDTHSNGSFSQPLGASDSSGERSPRSSNRRRAPRGQLGAERRRASRRQPEAGALSSIRCYSCGELGHKSSHCPGPSNHDLSDGSDDVRSSPTSFAYCGNNGTSSCPSSPIRCYNCGRLGHRSQQCRFGRGQHR